MFLICPEDVCWFSDPVTQEVTRRGLLIGRLGRTERDVVCLFSEPNSYEKKAGIRVDGYQLGQDFTRLREMMSESKLYRDAGLFGPDVGQPRDHRVDILEG